MRFLLETISDWWHKPVTRKDRVKGAIVGLIGGFWLTFIVTLFIAQEIGFLLLFLWSFGGAVFCGFLGVIFPKIISLILYPFSMFNAN